MPRDNIGAKFRRFGTSNFGASTLVWTVSLCPAASDCSAMSRMNRPTPLMSSNVSVNKPTRIVSGRGWASIRVIRGTRWRSLF